MTKILTTRNAQITTAAVEVKTLTISGKQVTLAVFRQLHEELLISQDGTLNGVPWGTVNYHSDKVIDPNTVDYWGDRRGQMIPCGRTAAHLHIVWQTGSELRRSLVWNPHWYAKHYADWDGDTDPERLAYRAMWLELLNLPQLFIAV